MAQIVIEVPDEKYYGTRAQLAFAVEGRMSDLFARMHAERAQNRPDAAADWQAKYRLLEHVRKELLNANA